MMKKAIVLGASGGMGYSLVKELSSRNIEVIAFSRNENKLNELYANDLNVTVFAGDVFDTNALTKAVAGIDVIFHSVSVPYPQWPEKHPAIMQNVLQAAKTENCKIVIVDNVYAYGRQDGKRVSEETPKNPHTKKGKIRLHLEDMVKDSGLPYVIAHFPDFYGRNADNTLIQHTLQNVKSNKRASYVGSLKIPREFIYTPDGAKALVEIAMRDSAYGQYWNIPGERLISGEELISLIHSITGYDKKVMSVSTPLIRFISLFSPFMREFLELAYLYEQPFQLDGSKYEREVGPLPKTAYREGLRKTLDF